MRFYVKRKRTPQIIIVSLIDIFAMLLIFFIVTTTFKTAQSELSIKLPESKTASAAKNPTEPMVLAITSEEKIILDDHPVKNVDELSSKTFKISFSRAAFLWDSFWRFRSSP